MHSALRTLGLLEFSSIETSFVLAASSDLPGLEGQEKGNRGWLLDYALFQVDCAYNG